MSLTESKQQGSACDSVINLKQTNYTETEVMGLDGSIEI